LFGASGYQETMPRIDITALFLLLILCVSLSRAIPIGHAAQLQQGIFATVNAEYVSVTVNFQIFQNLTSLENSFALPQFNGVLLGANSTDTSSAIQQALDTKSSQARVSALKLGLSTTAWNANSNVQWFNTSLQFQVRGVQTVQNGVVTVDMSWKSFSVAQNVSLGGVEVNNIGAKYLSSVAAKIAQIELIGGSFITYTNTVNSFRVKASNMATAAQVISLLDFTRVQPSVDSWHESYDVGAQMVTWSFKPSVIPGIIIAESIAEANPPTKVNFVLSYGLQAAVSAPARSHAQGDRVIVKFGDNAETLMGSIISVIIALGAVTFVYEKRTLGRGVTKKPKR
jgi:hypothetical protein